MIDPGTALWFFAVAGGALILGIAIAYGFIRSRQRTSREKFRAEQGAREIYEKEERQLDA
jgi:pantothenate kinase type III